MAIDTIFNIIYDVRANDQVLVSISPDSTAEYFYSNLYYPNQTLIEDTYESGSHAYNFVAGTAGNYLLEFKVGSGFGAGKGFNYTIKSSHPLTSGIQPTPSATVTPTPSPSASPSPTSTKSPLNVSVVASGSVTFEVPASFPSGIDKFTYDFGDGTNMTTSDRKVTHVYETPGSYIFTLKLEGATEVRVIETYFVTVTSPSENPLITYTWPIVTGIIAGLSVTAITAYVKRRKKHVSRARRAELGLHLKLFSESSSGTLNLL